MPADEARCAWGVITGLVERGMGGVFERYNGNAFVVVYGAVADKLHLRNARNGLQLAVENRSLVCIDSMVAVTEVLARRIEGLYKESELIQAVE